jgi:hypothetical protein
MIPPCLQCPGPHTSLCRRRGLCKRCYTRESLRVRRRETTWAELEGEGLALPAVPRGDGWRRFEINAKTTTRPERPGL